MAVPLSGDDPDIWLDLQAVFTDVYDAYALNDAINYAEPPEGRLVSEEKLWIQKLLKRSGKR